MENTYNSPRRTLTVASMICEILVALASGFFTLIFGVVLALGIDQLEDVFSRAEQEQMNELFVSVGLSFAEALEAICAVFVVLFIIAAIFAVISVIVSAVNISRSKRNYVTFNGDAIFKIVINALWVFGLAVFFVMVPNVIYFILLLLFGAPMVLSIIVLCKKLESPDSVAYGSTLETDNSAENDI
ncbi:MAG: hypothetical protein MJ153_03835 [Clostridia bacterium]|nr:hypothetical protein [Clostridia bacterium]